jgi:hypothetical protein
MIATPGVTKAHPVKCSELMTRARVWGAALGRLRLSEVSDAAELLVRVGEDLVDLTLLVLVGENLVDLLGGAG